jgi:hypothetical protein
MWYLCWYWGRSFSELVGFPWQVSFRHCSIHPSIIAAWYTGPNCDSNTKGRSVILLHGADSYLRADNISAGEEILYVFLNPKAHCHIRKSQPLDPLLNNINLMSTLILSTLLRLSLLYCFFPSFLDYYSAYIPHLSQFILKARRIIKA